MAYSSEGLPCLTDNLPLIAPDPRQTRTGFQYWMVRQKQERQRFEPWDVAFELLRSKRFRTQSEFAAYFKRSPRWATEFKALALRQHVVTLDEWKKFFGEGNKGRPSSDPRTYEEQLALSKPPKAIIPLEDEWSGFDIDGIEELIGAVLERLKAKEFCSEAALARFYHRPLRKVEAFRERVISGGLVTEDEWNALFVRFPKRRAVPLCDSWTTLALEALRPLLRHPGKGIE